MKDLSVTLDRPWAQEGGLGVDGTPGEIAALERLGFVRAEDCMKDVYYLLPNTGHIVHLYADGTWSSDKAEAGSSMKDYLEWIEAAQSRSFDQSGQ